MAPACTAGRNEIELLHGLIWATYIRGHLVIPAFAVERTQAFYHLYLLMKERCRLCLYMTARYYYCHRNILKHHDFDEEAAY